MKTILILLAGILLACGTTLVDAFESAEEVRVTVLYDNTCAVEGVESDWGFSCVVQGTGKTILFDAGTKPEIFARNVDASKVNLKNVERVFTSWGESPQVPEGDLEAYAIVSAMGAAECLLADGKDAAEVVDMIPVKPLQAEEAAIVDAYYANLTTLHEKLKVN